MTPTNPHPYLRYLAAWHRPESAFHATLDHFGGRPVRFSGVPRHLDDMEACLAAFVADPMAALTEAPDGTLLLPGNPHQVLEQLLAQQFVPPRPSALRRVTSPLHRVGAALWPHDGGGGSSAEMDRGLGWPDEPRIDRYRRALFDGLLAERRMLGRRGATLASLPDDLEHAPWPGGRPLAVCVIHEVTGPEGMAAVGNVAEERLALGIPPVFFVGARVRPWDHGALDEIRDQGGEIGLLAQHPGGLPGRSAVVRLFREIDAQSEAMARHEVRGVRVAAGPMTPPILDELARRFSYDCSTPDTSRGARGGTRRGCAVTVPFVSRGLIQLPVTMPASGQQRDEGLTGLDWLELFHGKSTALRQRQGLLSVVVRLDPGHGLDRVQRDLLASALGDLVDAGDAWLATPGQIAALWRQALDGPIVDAGVN
jgi:hypothetical protein